MVTKNLIKPWTRHPQKKYILQNVTVVNVVDGSISPLRTVTIADGKIETIRASEEDVVDLAESDATVVDLKGKYLCPGLIDCHVHLAAVTGEKTLGSLFGRSGDVTLLRVPYECRAILRRGFTTVRDCGGTTYAVKEAIQEGIFPGPRLFIAGRALSQTGGHGDNRGIHEHGECCGGQIQGLGRIVDGVPECIRFAREELRLGADFIKIMAGGGVASPTDRLENLQFNKDEIQAITTVADSYHTIVAAHAYTVQSIRHAIDNGVRAIEHGNMLDTDTAKLMAEKDVFLTPTLVTYGEMSSPRWEGFLPPESAEKNKKVLKAGLEALKIAVEAGVTICYGTDLLGAMQVAQTKEFAIRSSVLSPSQIMQSATINAARLLRQDKFLGQVKEGFAADLIVLNDNPLDDISIFDKPEKHLLAVIKDGYVEMSHWSGLSEE